MDQPLYEVGQQVKYKEDNDRLTGVVKAVKWDSEKGFTYEITSKFFDGESFEIVEGLKICTQDELVDMSGYDGSTTPIKPNKVVNLSDNATKQEETEPVTEVVATEVPSEEVAEEEKL